MVIADLEDNQEAGPNGRAGLGSGDAEGAALEAEQWDDRTDRGLRLEPLWTKDRRPVVNTKPPWRSGRRQQGSRSGPESGSWST